MSWRLKYFQALLENLKKTGNKGHPKMTTLVLNGGQAVKRSNSTAVDFGSLKWILKKKLEFDPFDLQNGG